MNITYKCEICFEEFNSYKSISIHRRHKHQDIINNFTKKEYFDKFFKKETDGICVTCGKPTQFISISKGYKKHCSNTCAQQDINTRELYKKNCEIKYGEGITNPMQSKEVMKSFLDKNGTDFFTKLAKIGNNAATKNGENPFQRPDVIQKIQKTNKEKYGVKYATCLKEYSNKAKKTNLEKYGTETPFLKHKGMTSIEKKLNEFLINRKFEFKYQYEINNKNFDFAIFKDGVLNILIELDGEYFHGLIVDCDGKQSRGDSDHERFFKTPDGVKLICCDGKNVEKCFEEILKIQNVDYETWIKEIINSMPTEFPYPNYDNSRLLKDYNNLINKDYFKNSQVGTCIIQQFHKSIWSAHKQNKLSPVECWNDKIKLEKVIRNRIIYKSNLSSHNIAKGFNICGEAKTVSVFNPILAKHIIKTYLNEFNTIFDPFSGFSGRMLGACSLNKKYIGQDINEIHVKESNDIINFLNLNADVKNISIFNSTGEYECLFTCSPYGLKEIWNENETNKTCDEWIDICLENFKCKKYCFIVDETIKYKDKIVDIIENKSHFGTNKEYIILI